MFHFDFLHGPNTVGSDLKGIARVLSEVCASEIFEMEFGGDACTTFNGDIHIGICWCSIFVSCDCYNFIIWKIKKNSSVCQELFISMMKTFKNLTLCLEKLIYIVSDTNYNKRIIKILIHLSRNTTPHWKSNQAVLQSCLLLKHNELTCFWWDIWKQFPGCLLIPVM